ncbi:glycoside hydrolase family 5 protein [Gymnodinialimonas sp. 2305UL16-5]|uniref:glycoside hydrolase family 5 protein n=1 Tax=Gymnodinialimonas mytili TaxID=3126503 RepID=UPI00309680A3
MKSLMLAMTLSWPLTAHAFPVARCINLGAAMEAPVEGDWGYIVAQDHIALIAEAGFDTIRLPVRFADHWDGERLDPAILARTDQVIGWAETEGLNTILDLHHFLALKDNPGAHIDTLINIWEELAHHYAGAPDSLMFELFNEPAINFTTELAVPVFTDITAMIRQTNPDRWIITGGGDWNDLDEMLRLPAPGHREVRTFHYYRPWDFTHQQAAYLNDPPPPSDWGSAQDRAALAADMAQAASAAGPVFLGEFGVYGATDETQRLSWIRAVRETAEANSLPWCYWGFSQGAGIGFSAYNTGTESWDPGMPATLLD